MDTGCGGAGAEASGRIEFDTLVHADWSAGAAGRWVARADRTGAGWSVTAPRPVGDLAEFVDGLSAEAGSVLAGFDLPFGLPAAVRRGDWAERFPPGARSVRHR